MAVPSSGSLSMRGIFSEKNEDDYGAANMDGESGLSLRGLSSDSHDDTSSGGGIDINTDGWLATTNTSNPAQTGANIDDTPYSMTEFYGYDHDHVASIHTTTFQPEFRQWVVPYQPLRAGSGFTTSNNSSNNSPTNLGSVTSAGTFTIGGLSGVNLSALYNYDSNQGSSPYDTDGEKIVLQFHSTGQTNFADSGWSTAKIYNGSSASGTLVVTLTRSSATSFNSTITSSTGTRATYTFDGVRAFSNHFGTDTTASNNSQHFLEIA